MPFFIKPGEVLLSKSNKDIQGYIAESWATAAGKPRPSSEKKHGNKNRKMTQDWHVTAWSYGYDGRFYRKRERLSIKLEFDEEDPDVEISTLELLPLRFANEELSAKLRRRGRTMWSCRSKRLIAYKEGTSNKGHGEGEKYMVDFSTYKQLHSDSPNFKAAYPNLVKNVEEIGPLVMENDTPPQAPEIFVFPSSIVGYNLRQKKWQDLQVDLIEDIVWNKQAFDHLVIDQETKVLVQALITNKLESEQATDLIKGKGNGLIILLHGGPGTGKTFTAESVAELAGKPLFRVTCGDIGTQPEKVEKYLESVLHLGKIWGCVVLLDEADVFLEQRTLTDLERNALVSVFLRVLEYYEGILILTSNRVGTFDEAFKSRIQLSLHYKALDQLQRRTIWGNFLNRLNSSSASQIAPIKQRKRKLEEGKEIDFYDIEQHLDDLAREEMNGRQIRNAITTARQLAKFEGQPMSYKHLTHVIKISGRFEKYLEGVRDNWTDDQIAREDGRR